MQNSAHNKEVWPKIGDDADRVTDVTPVLHYNPKIPVTTGSYISRRG
jgi:hypothetical protein